MGTKKANINYILINAFVIYRCHKPLLWLQQICEKEKNNSVDKVEHWYIFLPEALILHHCKLENITKNVVGKVYPALAQRDGLDSLFKFLAVLSIMSLVTWKKKFISTVVENNWPVYCVPPCAGCVAQALHAKMAVSFGWGEGHLMVLSLVML